MWDAPPPSLPPAAAGSREGAGAGSVPAAGLVVAQEGAGLLAAVAAVIVAVVLLVERYRSWHAAGRSWYESWDWSLLVSYLFVCGASWCSILWFDCGFRMSHTCSNR